MTTLVAVGIGAGYGDRQVLHGCDLSAGGGELVAVVGPNGAGKSTLLRVLCGLVRPTSGRVSLDGLDIASLARSELAKRIAVVPQMLETIFPFTVREVVALGRTARLGLLGRPGAADFAVVDRTMKTLALDALGDRRIDAVSGGERQRAVLGMALAQQSEVLLLDEPTVHLDPGHQVATLQLLRSLARDRGLAVVAVLHDLNLAAAVATSILVMDRGAIVANGTPSEVITRDLVRRVFGANLDVARVGGRPVVMPADQTSHADSRVG